MAARRPRQYENLNFVGPLIDGQCRCMPEDWGVALELRCRSFLLRPVFRLASCPANKPVIAGLSRKPFRDTWCVPALIYGTPTGVSQN